MEYVFGYGLIMRKEYYVVVKVDCRIGCVVKIGVVFEDCCGLVE